MPLQKVRAGVETWVRSGGPRECRRRSKVLEKQSVRQICGIRNYRDYFKLYSSVKHIFRSYHFFAYNRWMPCARLAHPLSPTPPPLPIHLFQTDHNHRRLPVPLPSVFAAFLRFRIFALIVISSFFLPIQFVYATTSTIAIVKLSL